MSHSSLRLVVRLSVSILGVSILLIMTGCGGAGGGTPNPSDITSVGNISPTEIATSTAATFPTDLASTKAALNGLSSIASTDSFLSDLGSSLTAVGSQLSARSAPAFNGSGSRALGAAMNALSALKGIGSKDIGSDVTNQLTKIATDISNFPTTKSLNETINLSGNSLGQYVKLTTATCAFSASLVTTDGGPLDTTNAANFKSASGQATLSLVVDPQNLPESSAIKDFKLRVNAGGSVALGATTVSGIVMPANLSFDYAESAVLALSFCQGTTGGKIVIKADSKNTGTIADPTTLGQSTSLSGLAPDITVSLSVYDDNGNLTFTQTWTGLDVLVTDLSN